MCGRAGSPGELDVHRHAWPTSFVRALRARRTPPYVDGWTLHLAGEPPYDVHPDRAGSPVTDHLEPGIAAVLAFSSPLGVEDLPERESQPLLDAHHEGVAALAPGSWWGVLPRTVATDPHQAAKAVAALRDAGAAGLQVPAAWLAHPADVAALLPALEELHAADLPLFVHPGPSSAPTDGPGWWAATVEYPAQLAAAWWSWTAARPAALRGLRCCFAAGAGLAPVHHERHRARGGDPAPVDPDTYVDLSGYGLQGFDALLRVLGIDALVAGSDHPYATALDIPSDPAAHHAVRCANPHRLMNGGTR